MRTPLLLLLPTLFTGAALLGGCNGNPQGPSPAPAPAAPTSQLVFADGWNKIELFANYAHTNIDAGAHFDTDRNACGYDASGALDLKIWNSLAADINTFMHSTRLADEQCRDLPDVQDPNFKFDGTADLQAQDGTKIMLFETRNWSVCSLIQDDGLYQRLLASVNALVLQADKEDCSRSPYGGGS